MKMFEYAQTLIKLGWSFHESDLYPSPDNWFYINPEGYNSSSNEEYDTLENIIKEAMKKHYFLTGRLVTK